MEFVRCFFPSQFVNQMKAFEKSESAEYPGRIIAHMVQSLSLVLFE